MRRISIDYGTIWVCQCCMLSHANGECCPDDSHGGDGIAPWATFDFTRFHAWMGLSREEHAEGCDPEGEWDCDCDRRSFSRSRCEGCGSWLAGYRHAFGVTRERQHFARPKLPA